MKKCLRSSGRTNRGQIPEIANIPLMMEDCLRDLDIAERAIERMARAKKFPELYEAWEDFLFRIERAWQRAETNLKQKKGFQQWFKPYADLRRKDPLLRFLKQARNAETHAVSKTLDKPIQFFFRDKLGRPFGVRSIQQELKDGVLTINVDTPDRDLLLSYEVSVIPTSPHLVRFKNRGAWYEPPKRHLGNRVQQDLHPVDAAKTGLAFYRGFVREAIARFSVGR